MNQDFGVTSKDLVTPPFWGKTIICSISCRISIEHVSKFSHIFIFAFSALFPIRVIDSCRPADSRGACVSASTTDLDPSRDEEPSTGGPSCVCFWPGLGEEMEDSGQKVISLSELEVWMVHYVSLRTVCYLLKSRNTLVLPAPAWGVGKDPQHKLASSWRQGHSDHSKVVPFLPEWVLSHGFPEHSGQRINCGPSIFGDSPDSGGLELHDFGVFFSDVQTFHQTFPIWRQQARLPSSNNSNWRSTFQFGTMASARGDLLGICFHSCRGWKLMWLNWFTSEPSRFKGGHQFLVEPCDVIVILWSMVKDFILLRSPESWIQSYFQHWQIWRPVCDGL